MKFFSTTHFFDMAAKHESDYVCSTIAPPKPVQLAKLDALSPDQFRLWITWRHASLRREISEAEIAASLGTSAEWVLGQMNALLMDRLDPKTMNEDSRAYAAYQVCQTP